MCPIPVNSDGLSASAASAVSTGASSLMSRRSAVMPRIRPVPRISRPLPVSWTAAPISSSTPRIWPAACRLTDGQPGIVTWPPVTTAAARNGAALDRSGSTVIVPGASAAGWTRQKSGADCPPPRAVPDSTSAPAAVSMAAVIAICGADGIREP